MPDRIYLLRFAYRQVGRAGVRCYTRHLEIVLLTQGVVTTVASPKLCRAVRANPHGRRLLLTQDAIHLGEDSVRERAEVDAPIPTEPYITRPVYAGDFNAPHLFVNLNNPPLARWPRVQPPELLPFARSPSTEIIPSFPATKWPVGIIPVRHVIVTGGLPRLLGLRSYNRAAYLRLI